MQWPTRQGLPTVSSDLETAAHLAAEKHLADCREAYWHDEMCDPDQCECCDIPVSPAYAPFDDCNSCIVREVLSAAWPFLQRLAQVSA